MTGTMTYIVDVKVCFLSLSTAGEILATVFAKCDQELDLTSSPHR